MPTACFLSPHLDDAVFSAGGTMARLRAAGWRVTMVTVFTRSVPPPLRPFALRCQTDKGLGADADYMAIRRGEDLAAGRALGLDAGEVVWLDLPEAPHRGYDTPADLFAGLRADDHDTTDRVVMAVRRHVAAADVLFTCAGIGDHVDHRHVRSAADTLTARGQDRPLVLWHDSPYVLRLPTPPASDFAVDITPTLPAKLDACAAYTTQLAFQFGGEAAMRRRLDHPTERFNGPATPLNALTRAASTVGRRRG